ncbi:MAG: hypothetical protein HP007_02650 [Bacteroides sp.]|jgi:hypothetical protein|nr:hypothetical protein [Bacteroides sp.]
MESTIEKKGSMNRCVNFVQNTELSNESKDYLVCLGMVEDLSNKMHELLVRDWGEECFNEEWDKWRNVTDQLHSLIMENFKAKLVANLSDLTTNKL